MAAPVAAIDRVKAFTDAMLAVSATSPFPEFAKPACEAMAEMPLHLLDSSRPEQATIGGGVGLLTLYTGGMRRIGRDYTLARFAALLMKNAPANTIRIALFESKPVIERVRGMGGMEDGDIQTIDQKEIVFHNGNKLTCYPLNSTARMFTANVILLNHAERLPARTFCNLILPVLGKRGTVLVSVVAGDLDNARCRDLFQLDVANTIDVSVKIPEYGHAA